MSVANGERLATKQDLADLYNGILPYLGGSADAGFTPIGTIIAVFAETAPINYLACDGSTYNKSDYPELASHLLALTDHSAYEVSGDSTKFKVPDLRGEFLRGTGTNSHTNQGSGAGVGVHQDATEHPYAVMAGNSIYQFRNKVLDNIVNADNKLYKGQNIYYLEMNPQIKVANNSEGGYISRPTNTSVLFCIATKNIFLNPALDYSTTEKIIGTWVDGKPIFEVVITGLSAFIPASASSWVYTGIGRNIPVDVLIDAKIICDSNGLTVGFDELAFYKGSEDSSHIHGIQFKRNGTSDRTATMAILQYTKTS